MLQPGHYKAEWTGPKDALQISVLDHGKTVATATGNLKELPSKSLYSAVTMRIHHNNANQVDEYRLQQPHSGARGSRFLSELTDEYISGPQRPAFFLGKKLLHDEVHHLARHVDFFDDLLSGDSGLSLFHRRGHVEHEFLGRIGGDSDAAA